MCGFAGFLDRVNSEQQARDLLGKMANAIRHRGPDDEGFWSDVKSGIGLAHRRLSIIDLSAEGHQPMASADQRYMLVFNGEIYNYKEIARDLEARGVRFRGSCDTEVILEGIVHWGLNACLSRFNGMFTLALWDRKEQRLSLARDRVGIKPLYYLADSSRVVFGSELKCIMAYPNTPRDYDHGAIGQLIRLGYIPCPRTVFKGVMKLAPGHVMHIQRKDGGLHLEGPQSFWNLAQVINQKRNYQPIKDEAEALAGFEEQLTAAVRRRLVADVPLGAFLSGGIDSSLVVAIMQKLNERPVKTFSIGFADEAYNEATHAAEIAAHLGTEHHELYLGEKELRDLVPSLPDFYCEPFADSSQLPTLLLAGFARHHVTVALSGDGGDELAGGYVRHVEAARLNRLGAIPGPLRRLMGAGLTTIPTGLWDRAFHLASPLLPKRARIRLPGDKMHKLGRAIAARDLACLYREVVSLDTVKLMHRDYQTADPDHWWSLPQAKLSPAEDFMVRDFFRYLPDDVLTKVDRATMAHALEARVPLLDHELVGWMWGIDASLKVKGATGKYLLRQLLNRHVPQAMWDRAKMGFAAPVGHWIKGSLKAWAEDLLADVRSGQVPFFDASQVEVMWRKHLNGSANVTSQCWHLLMFLAWRRRWQAP